MRLVIEYGSGDGCTYHCTVTEPVEYESAAAFAVDFEKACREAASSRVYTFDFAGHEWSHGDFVVGSIREYYPPEILTVDEWFARPARY